METLNKIYEEFRPGSWGLCKEIMRTCSCMFDISDEEVERIGEKASSAEEFVEIWENSAWWTDDNNGTEDDDE